VAVSALYDHMFDATDNGTSDPGAWERTVTEMRELAADREAEGWETVTVRAGDTAPEPPDAGESDRFGFVYTVPGSAADSFRAVYEAGEFDSYTVYRRQAGDTLFLVTEVVDTDAERAVFLAGAVDLGVAGDLREAAVEAGELHSHVQLLDWTHLGSFRHDDPAAFFPSLG